MNKNQSRNVFRDRSGWKKRIRVPAAAVLCLLLAIGILSGCGGGGGKAGVIAEGQFLSIPKAEISEKAKFYPVEVDGTNMEVFAIMASDGTIRTAFNTCQSCYTSGQGFYKQEGDDLVCNNCGFHFTADQVEVASGGCNPWPIFEEDKTVTEDEILISYEFLSASKDIFANWNKANK